jgi:hypothetical protein
MRNKDTRINELIEKYDVTDDEIRQITEVASLYADMNIDKRKNLLKWTTVFDVAMRKALLKLRPDIDDDELRIVFNKFIKETTIQINLNNMDRLLFTVFKQGVEYQKTLNNYE